MKYVTEWRDSLETIENVGLHCNLGSLSEETISPALRAARRPVSIKLSLISRQHRCFIGKLGGVTGRAGVS